MTDRVLVVIPCFNCERQVVRVLAQFSTTPSGVFDEVLVLDNRSDDATVDVAIDALPRVGNCKAVVARNRENYNLGGSHKAA